MIDRGAPLIAGPFSFPKVLFRNAGQPSPVWDRVNDRLVMNFVQVRLLPCSALRRPLPCSLTLTSYGHAPRFLQVSPGDNYQSVSSDYGKTWTSPVSLRPVLGAAVVSEVGPGVGIQLRLDAARRQCFAAQLGGSVVTTSHRSLTFHSPSNPHAPGRMLFIGHHSAYQYDSVWYTDDGGNTYNLSKTNFKSMDEVRVPTAFLQHQRKRSDHRQPLPPFSHPSFSSRRSLWSFPMDVSWRICATIISHRASAAALPSAMTVAPALATCSLTPPSSHQCVWPASSAPKTATFTLPTQLLPPAGSTARCAALPTARTGLRLMLVS